MCARTRAGYVFTLRIAARGRGDGKTILVLLFAPTRNVGLGTSGVLAEVEVARIVRGVDKDVDRLRKFLRWCERAQLGTG